MCSKIATSISTKNNDAVIIIPLQKGAYQLGIAATIEKIAHHWQLAAPAHDDISTSSLFERSWNLGLQVEICIFGTWFFIKIINLLVLLTVKFQSLELGKH